VRLRVAFLAGAAIAAGCGGHSASAPRLPSKRLDHAALVRHVRMLQRIADGASGTRAVGTAGYAASVRYVVRELRDAGYRPRLQPVRFTAFRETAPARLELDGKPARRKRDFVTMQFSGSGDVRANVAPVAFGSASSGCDPDDFDGFARGSVALVRRGGCFFFVKVRTAQAAGAAAVLVASDGPPLSATLGGPGTRVPVLVVSKALGSRLAHGGEVRISVHGAVARGSAPNVIAELAGRERDHVVVVGAHLDSVPSGPGVNDNGSGTAVVLELARELAQKHARPRKTIRFGFWAAEELGLYGSNEYAESLGAERNAIDAYVNLDMVASPNYAWLVYDGDGSAGGPPGPDGSAAIERDFRAFFARRGLATGSWPLIPDSDHAPFQRLGIPVGGLFTGEITPKPAEQARRFGGQAGKPYDPCYHQACDTFSHLSTRALAVSGDATATVVLALANAGP
jgi:Zn-dependent M28 family amino/carboxypeptidase